MLKDRPNLLWQQKFNHLELRESQLVYHLIFERNGQTSSSGFATQLLSQTQIGYGNAELMP
jgi:hypothetical protein